MINRKGFTLIELMIIVIIIGILAAITIPTFMSMQDRAKEAKVKGGALTLQLASEDFSVRNEGFYSDQQYEIQQHLPNDSNRGQYLQNAFTGQWTEPRYGEAADAPGEIGIVVVLDACGIAVGYTINGWGKDGEIILLSSGR